MPPEVEEKEEEVEEKSEEKEAPAQVFEDVELDLPEEKEKEEPEPEKKEEVKPPEPTAKEKELEERTSRLETDKKNLQKALHEARQERKKSKEPETQVTLTDAELQKIVEEHKDDPKVVFNALTYKMQQLLKTGKVEAVNEVEIKGKQRELDGILRQRVKDFDDESSESRATINQAKSRFNLDDHPFGDFLGTAAAVYIEMPNILKNAREEGKKEALNEKAEDARKKGIKESQATPAGQKFGSPKSGGGELTVSQMDTAKRLGFTTPEKLKLYKSQILKVSGSNA
jgi:hypothetical protein